MSRGHGCMRGGTPRRRVSVSNERARMLRGGRLSLPARAALHTARAIRRASAVQRRAARRQDALAWCCAPYARAYAKGARQPMRWHAHAAPRQRAYALLRPFHIAPLAAAMRAMPCRPAPARQRRALAARCVFA